jgi:hypothetical protein
MLQGRMKQCTKVIAATRQRHATVRASTSATGACPGVVLLKFGTNEDCQATLRGRKGLAGSKLGLDKDLTPTQQVRKLELWSLIKEAKSISKRAFWHAVELFVKNTQICPPSSI